VGLAQCQLYDFRYGEKVVTARPGQRTVVPERF
jgi:hypothetical protein